MLIETRPQRLYASHHQFYVADGAPFCYVTPAPPMEAGIWTAQHLEDRIAPILGMLGVRTGTYGYVKVITEIHSSRPELHLEQWDHVTECSLDARSGHLIVIGCMELKGERFQVTPGTYRVRCCHANLSGSKESGEGEDWYRIQIWPAAMAGVAVLKRAPRLSAAADPAPAPAAEVSLQRSLGGPPILISGPNHLTARAVTLRRILAAAYAIYPEREFPLDRIVGPPLLDQGRYDASAVGPGWTRELRRLISEEFRWRFDMVAREPGPGQRGLDGAHLYYVAVSDRSPPSLRLKNIRRRYASPAALFARNDRGPL